MKVLSEAEHDWSRFDAMTPEQSHQVALDDPDAQPLTEEDFARMKRTPQVKVMRRALGLSQEKFSARVHPAHCAAGSRAAKSRTRRRGLI